jgi:putative MFS transporter
MFFDGYDLYVAGPVLGAAVQSNFSTLRQNGWFLSLTFVGMTFGRCLPAFLAIAMAAASPINSI